MLWLRRSAFAPRAGRRTCRTGGSRGPTPRRAIVLRMRLPLFSALVLLLSGCGRSKGGEAAPTTFSVAAASDLSAAFQELGTLYERQTGRRAAFTFGSTGLLAKQLHEGGPYDLFAAANVQYADAAVQGGDCDGATKALYGRGRIVLWADTDIALPSALSGLVDPRFAKIAIANPDHAPYGRAAKEALERAGVWRDVETRVVYGENVQQTLKFAQSGNAEVAIVALSLAIVTKGHFVPVDEASYQPIDQALVACRRGSNFEAGRDFGEFVNSRTGRDVMKRYGFLLPGEAVARSP